jgi:ketosteroid isomerase-like protein
MTSASTRPITAANASEQLLLDVYAAFGRGDLEGLMALCAADMTFTVPGNNGLARTYSLAEFPGMVQQVMEMSGGTFREEVVDIFANERHGVALLDHTATRDGRPIAYRTAHCWDIRDGKFCAWREWPGDQDAFDRAWG